MKKLLITASIYLIALLSAASIQAAPFSSLYAFGDSLSDGGNSSTAVMSIYKLLSNNCDLGHPCPPYVDGHYSNGKVAVEYLADSILPGGANPGNFFNFAVAGATSGIGNYGDGGSATQPGLYGLPGVQVEVASYLSITGGFADPGALYFIWGGANDFLTNDSPVDAAQNIASTISVLIGAGANHFFIPNLPDLGLTPLAGMMGLVTEATGFSMAFNAELAAQLALLNALNPAANLILFDTFSIFNQIIANPDAYGFTNTDIPCLLSLADNVCSDPGSHLLWDDLHPTTQAHAVFATAFARAIPLPGTFALLMAGLLALILLSAGKIKHTRIGTRATCPRIKAGMTGMLQST